MAGRRVVRAVLAAATAAGLLLAVSGQPAGAADQTVFGYGDATYLGSTGDVPLNYAVVGMARTGDGTGYWLASREGRVHTFGSAPFYGNATIARPDTDPVVGIAAAPGSNGYWMADRSGDVYGFGNVGFFGSLGGGPALNAPVLGITATPSGNGYWLVARDGGVFSFGDARFYGSTGAMRLNQPVVGMTVTPTGRGYWLVAQDGGIFSFGDARFYGSTGNIVLNKPIVNMAARSDGKGYWMVAVDGGVFAFGSAKFYGSLGATGVTEPIVSITATPSSSGYWITSSGHLANPSQFRPAETRMQPGTYRADTGGIPAGTYRTQYSTPKCHWERRSSFSGTPDKVVASNTAATRQVVTISPGDTFITSGCGPWTNDMYPVLDRRHAGDGIWQVGRDLDMPAGQWQASGGPNCTWTRLGGFTGEGGDIKATGNGVAKPVVAIATNDVGFASSGCDAWTRLS